MSIKKSIAIAAIVVLLGAAGYYLYISGVLQRLSGAPPMQGTNAQEPPVAHSVNAVSTYAAPDGTNTVRFTLGLDAEDRITSVRATDVEMDPEENAQLAEFSQKLLVVIKGKKLSELKAVDKVGTSSLTTKAFNSALTDLKARE